MTAVTDQTGPRALHEIAREIHRDWGARVYFGAAPYLAAMCELDGLDDRYGQDDARDIVRRFLVNAGTWRGPVARRIKAELRAMVP